MIDSTKNQAKLQQQILTKGPPLVGRLRIHSQHHSSGESLEEFFTKFVLVGVIWGELSKRRKKSPRTVRFDAVVFVMLNTR